MLIVAVLALTEPNGHQREAYFVLDTPAPTPGVAVPLDAPTSALV